MASAQQTTARSGVFVSYARKDGEAIATALRDKLLARNVSVWQDRTGMQGGRDWWEQIKEALNHVEYMVLVMTPSALQSEVVRKEWRYARQQGVCVYPVIASPGLDLASLPRWMNSVHWYDLARQEAKFFNDLNTRCQLRRVPFMAEPLPLDFVPRSDEFERLKSLLLSVDREEPAAITAALRGAGGYGKTTLARALCNDDDIQNAFDDGVLWVTLGEAPSAAALLSKLNDLIETLSDERPAFEGIDAAATRLRELLADRDLLLVIDDVWRAADLRPFLTGGTRCARLITTRRADTLPPNAAKVPVDAMQQAEGTQLLRIGLPAGQDDSVAALAARLGHWPLLLKLGNSWLGKRVADAAQPFAAALATFDKLLTQRGLTAFDAKNPAERNEAAAATLELSFAGLEREDQARLQGLAIFEEDLDIPLAVLQRCWGETQPLDEWETEEACQRLFSESLLVAFNLEERTVRLHDAIRAWLIGRVGGEAIAGRHAHLLDSYRQDPQPWHRVADDGYIHAHLPAHLVGAGRTAELRGLLLDLDWMALRLSVSGRGGVGRVDVFGLVGAYDALADESVPGLVQRALQMSSHVLAGAPDELPLQLYGRLGTSGDEGIQGLCGRAVASAAQRALLPQRPALLPPGALRFTLAGHQSSINGATLLAEGRQALSWSHDGTLKLWDLQRGELLHSLDGHENSVIGAALLAKGRQALSWSNDGSLKLWNLQHGALLHSLAGHRGSVEGAMLLAEGQRALSWSYDGLKLWDLQRGELLHSLSGHERSVNGARLLAEGQQVLSWSKDRTLKLWDLHRGGLLHSLVGHEDSVTGATLLAEGRRALSWSDDGTLKLWDLQRGELMHTLAGHENSVRGAALLAEGWQALSWSDDRTLKLWDLGRGELLHSLPGHGGAVYGATLLAEGRQALSWSSDGTLKLWDLQRGELLHSLAGHADWVNGATLLAEGRQALSWSGDGTLRLWNLQRGKLLQSLAGHEGSVSGATLLAEGRQAVSWSSDGTLKLWDLQRGESLQSLTGHWGSVYGATLLAEGRQALSWSHDRTLKLWDLQRGELLHGLTAHEDSVRGATLLAEGRQALSWSYDGTLKLWDLQRGELLHSLAGHEGWVNGATPLTDGRQALSWSRDRTLKLWDLQRGELLHSLAAHEDSVRGATLLAEGRQALSWSHDHTLKLWDLQRGEGLHSLAGHEGWVLGATLLAEGRQALSWSEDYTLRLWDLQRGDLLYSLAGHESSVIGARLLAEGRQALSWSYDGTLKLWDLQRGELQNSLVGHEKAVRGATLLAEGRQALSWSVDRTLKLWDLQRGEMLHSLIGHEGGVTGATLLAEGRQALSWSDDRTLRLWDLKLGKQLDLLSTDYQLTVVCPATDETQLLAFDSSGRMHLLRLKLDRA